MAEEEKAKIILKKSGEVNIHGDFNQMNLIGLLEHELAYQKAQLQIKQEQKIRKELKNNDKNKS